MDNNNKSLKEFLEDNNKSRAQVALLLLVLLTDTVDRYPQLSLSNPTAHQELNSNSKVSLQFNHQSLVKANPLHLVLLTDTLVKHLALLLLNLPAQLELDNSKSHKLFQEDSNKSLSQMEIFHLHPHHPDTPDKHLVL